MSRPEIVEDVIAAAAAVPQALDRLSEEARAAWAGQLAADIAAERRASGVTVAPEAALHRALQARTDELERVRAERDSALADLLESATCLEALESERQAVLAMVEQHAGGSPRLVDEVRAALRSLARERDEAQAALAEARAENASLLAVVPPGTHVPRVEWGVHAEVTRQRNEILRLTRERDEARATCSELRQAVGTIEAAYDRVVSERDEARAEIAAALREIPIEQHRLQPGKPPVVLRDEVAHVVREWARRNHEFDRVWDACETVLTADEARAVEWTDEQQGVEVLVLAAIAKVKREHAGGFSSLAPDGKAWRIYPPPAPDGDAPTMTITATDPEDAARRVREYVSAYAPPTAGAADPLRLSGTSRPPATWWPASDTRTPVACDISPGADNYDTQALLRRRHGE